MQRQSDAGPGRVYSVPYLTPASVVLIWDLHNPSSGGKLFFYQANIFRLMRFPKVPPSLWVPVLGCGDRCMPQIISQLQRIAVFPSFPLVGEPDALLRAPAHEQRIDNPT